MLYEVDYSVGIPEFGVLNIEALDADEAESIAVQRLKETYPEAVNIEIEMVRKI